MRAEYDLVVIGDSLAARWAALSAVRHYARVAFIQQSKSDLLARSVLFQELAGLVTTSISQGLPFPFETVSSLRLWLVRRGAELLKPLGLNRLAHNGVDVLTTPGNFLSPDPQTPFPIFESQGRQFRSRYYLLAMDAAIAFNANQSQLSDLQPLEAILSKIESFTCQDQIFIQGRYPWAILLGQILNRLGYSITIFGEESILSREDPDISFHFQCQLESEGIVIQKGGVQVTSNQRAFVLTPICPLPWDDLRLENLGFESLPCVDPWAPQVMVNSKLETQNSRIYACGSVLGGYSLQKMADHEASIALKNLLFQGNQSLHYEQLAYSLPLAPVLIRIGLTEPQARRNFSVEVLTRSIDSTSVTGEYGLFCKVIAKSTGEILGIHWVGDGGHDLVEVFEQIVRERFCVSDLGRLCSGSIMFQMVCQDFAHRWDTLHIPRKRDRLERYFRRKRKQFS